MLDTLSPRTRGIGLAVLGVVAALVAYLLVGRDDDAKVADGARPALPAEAVSADELKDAAAAQGRPLYWAGIRSGTTLELTRAADGSVYVRYLTGSAEPGDASPDFLTVATYPVANGFETVSSAATQDGAERYSLPAGGVAVTSPDRPSSVYFSYPGADYQVEVYAPDPSVALDLVRSGEVKPVGGGTPVASGSARGLDLEALQALGKAEPTIFWAGPRNGVTYEVTHTPNGRTFVRYLPSGTNVGDPRPAFLTVATYPEENALDAVRNAGKKPGVKKLDVADGAIAIFSPTRPTSVFVAFPDVDYQVEVYSPNPGAARALVEQGRIVPVG